MSPHAVNSSRVPRPAPGWRVAVEAHDVARWRIEAQTVQVRAINETQARITAVREVHRGAGVPPWKPFARCTYLRTRVVSGAQQLPESRSRIDPPLSQHSGVSPTKERS